MAWPLAVGMLSFTLMGVVDTLLMGHVGTSAQAGVGLAVSVAWTLIAFFRGLISGSQALVAASHGAGDRERLRRAAGAGVLVGLVSGLVSCVLLASFAGPVLGLLVGDSEGATAIGAHAVSYLEIRAFGLPLTLTAFGLMSGLQGIGDMRSRMWVSLAGNTINAVADVVLIFGAGPVPALGVPGAAWATVASSGLMCLLYGVQYLRRFGRPRLPSLGVLRDSVSVGLPAGAQSLLAVIAWVMMNVVLARVGPVHLAASEIVIQIASLSFLPGYGLSEAGGVLVGRYLGAGRPRTAARTIRSARWLAVTLMGTCGFVFLVGGEAICSLFTRDPRVAALAGQLMLFAAAFQVLDAVAMVHLCALRSAGDTRFTFVLTTAASWGLTVPLSLSLGLWLGWGAPGAWLGLTLEMGALAGITAWRVTGVRSGRVGRLDLLLGRA